MEYKRKVYFSEPPNKLKEKLVEWKFKMENTRIVLFEKTNKKKTIILSEDTRPGTYYEYTN